MEPSGGRRATDNISAAIRLAIEESAAETRHTLRSEVTVFAAHLEAFRLQSTQEHTEVKGHVMDLIDDMAEVKKLIPKVADLEKNDAVLDALAANRKWMIGAMTALASLIVATAGVLAAILQH